ncbi:MAG: serine--tRNA ligase, partial [Roseiflexaceae bacterium]
MLDIRLIREQTDLVKATLAKAGVEPQLVDNVLIYDTQRRTLLQEV